MDHPNILKVYEVLEDKLHFYIITEYCSGGELFDKIKTMRYFSESLAAKYLK